MDEHVLKKISWDPYGVCARMIYIELEGDVIRSIDVRGGCPGYSIAIAALLEGMDRHEAVAKLEGIRCGEKQTSCADQIADALRAGESNC